MVRSFAKFFIVIAPALVSSVFANRSADKIWQEIDEATIKRPEAERIAVPSEYKVFRANKTNLNSILEKAPAEFSGAARGGVGDIIITLPLPDGTYSRFKIQYSPIMEAGLAAKYRKSKAISLRTLIIRARRKNHYVAERFSSHYFRRLQNDSGDLTRKTILPIIFIR